MRLLKEGQTAEQEVDWDDQKNINSFSKLNNRLTDLEDSYAVKTKEVEALDDATNELDLLEMDLPDEDEDAEAHRISYRLGDCFFLLPFAEVRKRLGDDLEATKKDREQIRFEIDGISREMEILKKALYGKFGDAIHLERGE